MILNQLFKLAKSFNHWPHNLMNWTQKLGLLFLILLDLLLGDSFWAKYKTYRLTIVQQKTVRELFAIPEIPNKQRLDLVLTSPDVSRIKNVHVCVPLLSGLYEHQKIFYRHYPNHKMLLILVLTFNTYSQMDRCQFTAMLGNTNEYDAPANSLSKDPLIELNNPFVARYLRPDLIQSIWEASMYSSGKEAEKRLTELLQVPADWKLHTFVSWPGESINPLKPVFLSGIFLLLMIFITFFYKQFFKILLNL